MEINAAETASAPEEVTVAVSAVKVMSVAARIWSSWARSATRSVVPEPEPPAWVGSACGVETAV